MREKITEKITPLRQMWAFLLTGLLVQTGGFFVSSESLLIVVIGATISLIGLSYVLRKACSFAFIDLLFYGVAVLVVAVGILFIWNVAMVAVPSFVIAFLSLYLSCSALIEGMPATKTFNLKEQMLYQLTRVQLYNLAKRHMASASMKWKKSELVKSLSRHLDINEIELYLLKSKKDLHDKRESKSRGSKLSLTLGGTILSLSLINVLHSTTAILGASMLVQSILAYKGKIKSI